MNSWYCGHTYDGQNDQDVLSLAFYFLCLKREDDDQENGRQVEYPPQGTHGEDLIDSNPYRTTSAAHLVKHKLRMHSLTRKIYTSLYITGAAEALKYWGHNQLTS